MSLPPEAARALRLQYQQLLLWGLQIQQGRIEPRHARLLRSFALDRVRSCQAILGGAGLLPNQGRRDWGAFQDAERALVCFFDWAGRSQMPEHWDPLQTELYGNEKLGELAIVYFDASSLAAPKLTAYGYNGENASNSWSDGNGSVAGTPPGDLIKGTGDAAGFINSISAQDVNVPGTGVRRVMSFDIDATDLVAHAPLYPTTGVDWSGTGFGSLVGVWFHPVKSFSATYTGGKGGLNSLQLGSEGYLDGSNLLVPAPGAMALLGLGALVGGRRRRAM